MKNSTETTTIEIVHVSGDGIALYTRFPGQTAPQPCFVELDCDKRTLTAESNPEIGNAVPVHVWHHRILRWTIPCLTDDAVNALLDELADDAGIVCDGYTCEWDGSDHVGRYTDDAEAAMERIREACARDWSEADQVRVWTADEWYQSEGFEAQIASLGITAETTDEQIAEIAEREEEAASAEGHTVEGIEKHMEWLRDKCRAENGGCRYTLRSDGADLEITAEDLADARRQARDWIRDGSYDEISSTIWVDCDIMQGGEVVATVTEAMDPVEPECSDETGHDWRAPHHLVGGLVENPGVHGHGGGVVSVEVCILCGCKRTCDSWAQRPDTGEQGLNSVEYEEGAFQLHTYAVIDEDRRVVHIWSDARTEGGLGKRGDDLVDEYHGTAWLAVEDAEEGDCVDEGGRVVDED